MMFRHVLIALDISDPHTEAVLPCALETARAARARVTLLTVIPTATQELIGLTGIASPGEVLARADDATALAATAAETAHEYLAALRDQILDESENGEALQVAVRVERGRTADAILRMVAEADVDLIAMATHGRRGLRRTLMGSISDEVLRRSDRPLLLVAAG